MASLPDVASPGKGPSSSRAFLASWLLFSIVFPLTVVSGVYIKLASAKTFYLPRNAQINLLIYIYAIIHFPSQMPSSGPRRLLLRWAAIPARWNELLDLVQFYTDCSPEDGLPPAFPLGLMGLLAQEQARAETLLARMFNNKNGSSSGGSEKELDTLDRQTQVLSQFTKTHND
jgi:hypothetical protein